MSPRQLELIDKLIDELGMIDPYEVDDVLENLNLSGPWKELSTEDASLLIVELIQMKRSGDFE